MNFSFFINQQTLISKFTPLHYASAGGHTQVAEFLVKEYQADPTIINANYDDCLSLAIQIKSYDLAYLFMDHFEFNYLRINVRTGLTHFSYAVLKNQFDIAEQIKRVTIKQGTQLDLNQSILTEKNKNMTLMEYCDSNNFF